MPDAAAAPGTLGILTILIVFFALMFDYINGFHDTANAIATVVSTRVMTPRVAIIMAAALNFLGALVSTNVAKTIASGLVDSKNAPQTVILGAVLGAIVWNLITWRFGIPSSSSHALVGGLCGSTIAHAGLDAVKWKGVLEKVIYPLVGSPICGFLIGLLIMGAIYRVFANVHPGKISAWFHSLQIFSAAGMAFTHGMNDAQKSMGIITLALVGVGAIAKPAHGGDVVIPIWVVLACATAMALGTSAGGWRIIRTMGHKIIRLVPVQGFAAEAAAATTILTASHFGMPVSTTHVIAGSIFGVGVSKRLSAVRWGVAQTMVAAWVLTLPAAGLIGALAYALLHAARLG